MLEVMRSRFGGSWDGDSQELHGLIKAAGKKLKVELMLIEATGQWQCCVFVGGECVSLELGEQPVEITARALAAALSSS